MGAEAGGSPAPGDTAPPSDAGHEGAGPLRTRPRAWAISIGLLVVLYAVSFLTLLVVEVVMHENAVELGWIDE